jgi:hypothetical protein
VSEEDKVPPTVHEPLRKGGYQPANEGYQPRDQRGFSPTNTGAVPVNVPTPPVTGGTGTVKPTGSIKKE